MLLLCALVGLVVGALLNLCADQLPRWRRLVRMPFCPYCEQPRPPQAWISSLALLCFRPECPSCGAPIPWRHPATELGLASLFAALGLHYGPTPLLLAYGTVSALFILIAVVDVEHGIIPNVIIGSACGLAVLCRLVTPTAGSVPRALLGGAVGFSLLFVVHLLGRLFTQAIGRVRGERLTQVAFGLGDVRLGAFIGLVLGIPQVYLGLLLGLLLAGLAALLHLVVRTCTLRRFVFFSGMPFGPYLAAGAMIMMLFHAQLGQWLAHG